jgi:hypothetical protein
MSKQSIVTVRSWCTALAVAATLLEVNAVSAVEPEATQLRAVPLEGSSAFLSGGANWIKSGFQGNLLLPASGAPALSFGFAVPDDYAGGDLTLEAQLGSQSTACAAVLSVRSLYRAREGAARDLGAPNGGVQALSATTAFVLQPGKKALAFQLPAQPGSTVGVRFRLASGVGGFPAYAPGDAVNLTLERLADHASDTCSQHLAWVAARVTYAATTARPARAIFGLDPHASFDSNGGGLVSTTVNQAPLRWPAATPGFPTASWSFVLPEDYKTNTPVDVDILWESETTGCSVVLEERFLYRASVDSPRDHSQGPSQLSWSGLSLESASTARDGGRVEAPVLGTVGRVRFRIADSPGTFGPLAPGTAITFGIARRNDQGADTCGDAGIAGVAVRYIRGPARAQRRLSFNALGAQIDEKVTLQANGTAGSVRVAKFGAWSTSFVLPADYKPNTPLSLQAMFESRDRNCDFTVRDSFLFRSRPGSPTDTGNAAGGLRPVNASTPFDLVFADEIAVSTTAEDRAILVRFEITTDEDVPSLSPGDGIGVGLHRTLYSDDTCPGDIGLLGWSVVYQKK